MRYKWYVFVVATLVVLVACDSEKNNTSQPVLSNERTKPEMKTMSGKITIENLPPNRGISADIAFFHVDDESAPKPFDGDPPGDAIVDLEKVIEDVDLSKESEARSRDIPFLLNRPAGHYYIQLRFILYRFKDDKAYAQAEQFFFGKRTLPLFNDIAGIVLSVKWPSIPLEKLGSYGTIEPKNR